MKRPHRSVVITPVGKVMNNLRFWAIALTSISMVFSLQISYSQTYDFQNWTVENGLSQSQILGIFQDRDGELWLGTNQGGVNRFDGRKFIQITKEDGLADNVVYSFDYDAKGRIIVGTGSGLSIVSGRRILNLTTENGLPHNGVVKVFTDLKGTTWLGTGKGLARLDGDSVRPNPIDSILDGATILNIRQDDKARLWFCTVKNGLFCWDGVAVKQYTTKNGMPFNYVFDVMPMADSAWIFNYRGLFLLKEDTITEVIAPELRSGAQFFSYCQNRAGDIWVGTNYGVLRYSAGSFKFFSQANGLVDNNIWKLIEDREGNMWFASKSNGLSRLNSERFRLYDSEEIFPLKSTNAICADSLGNVWIGTKRSLVKYANGTFETMGKTVIDVYDIEPDGRGGLWLGTMNAGLVHFDGKRFTQKLAPDILGDAARSIFDLKVINNILYLGTKSGLWSFDGKTFSRPKGAEKFTENIYHIAHSANGTIWCGYENGVLKISGEVCTQLAKKDGLFDGRCRSILVGSGGVLWFGSNEGVCRFDGNKTSFISTKEGLFSDAVYSLMIDRGGAVWVGQSKGVCKIVFDTQGNLQTVVKYGRSQGFKGLGCANNAMVEAMNGEIFVGTSSGLVAYSPSYDHESVHRTITRIQSVKLFSKEDGIAAMSDSVSDAGLPIGLKLPFNQNHLTFEFSGVTLTNPSLVLYSYYMDGFDESWSQPTSVNEAVYANLPPGKYTFRVKSGFGDELVDSPEVNFSFEILPPFYQTTWFYTLCIAIALGFIYSYYAIRRANTQITRQKEEIEVQKSLIERKNVEVMDSINYARTIQEAILPSDDQWHNNVGNSFVLYMPKDIVSGDFYWTEKRGSNVLFAAVDCTGHGVPGAFMSIIGYNGLNSAVNEHRLTRPDIILNFLNMSVNEGLRKREGRTVKDGMDIALCALDRAKGEIEFAGAYNSAYVIKGDELEILKGERRAIGTEVEEGKGGFKSLRATVSPGNMIYVFSDGYADQFGGKDGKKLKTSGFRDLLLSLHHLPVDVQKMKLREFFHEWRGVHEQIDDVCVIGVRV